MKHEREREQAQKEQEQEQEQEQKQKHEHEHEQCILGVDKLAADLGRDLGVGVAAHHFEQRLLLLARDVLLVAAGM
jgi:beta-phosphoglucomutase-like phosphatase (HAD superfamily)